jgi:purine-cytosine permease-like protein
MAKITAWLVTLIGVLMLLPLIGVSQLDAISKWIIPLAVLVIGIAKLMRNYKK